MKHLLVTNDFPPKIGGIQSLLWELWRRLPHTDFKVMTTPYQGDAAFDSQQAYSVIRTRQKWLLPTRRMVRQINAEADAMGADFVVLDPAFPLGFCGPRLNRPYVLVVHGAELVIPAHMPLVRKRLRRLFAQSVGVIASGQYVFAAVRAITKTDDVDLISIPPGVDANRFKPLTQSQKVDARQRFGLEADKVLVVGVSRLVARKGFDRLIKAIASLAKDQPDLELVIAGSGRDEARLKAMAVALRAPVTFLGRVEDSDLPALYGCGDIFAMACHDRWFGLEHEGFGIVFVEAAAAGLPTVVGHSGGSDEALIDGETGFLVRGGVSSTRVESALRKLTESKELRSQMGVAGRSMVEQGFSYDNLAESLQSFLQSRAVSQEDSRATLRERGTREPKASEN